MIQKVIYRGSRKLGSWQGCRLITFFGGWRWSGTAAGVTLRPPPLQACPRELPYRSGTAGRGREVQVGAGGLWNGPLGASSRRHLPSGLFFSYGPIFLPFLPMES